MLVIEIPSQIDLATLNVFLGVRSIAANYRRQQARLHHSRSSSLRDSAQLMQPRRKEGDEAPVPAIPDGLAKAAKPTIVEQDCETGNQTVVETFVF